jgi:hypothetical protein
LIGRREVGVTSEVERRDGEQKRRSGGRGKASGKRRRNGQPVDDMGEIRRALLEMKVVCCWRVAKVVS